MVQWTSVPILTSKVHLQKWSIFSRQLVHCTIFCRCTLLVSIGTIVHCTSFSSTLVHCTIFFTYTSPMYHFLQVHQCNVPLFTGELDLLVLVQKSIVPVFPGTPVHCTIFAKYASPFYHIFKVHQGNVLLFAGIRNMVQYCIVPVCPGT